MPSPIERWVLPVPGGPRKTTFSFPAMKSRVPRWATTSRLSERWWSKSNSSIVFLWREPSGPDADLPAVGLTGGDLALEAGGQELLVAPPFGPGPLAEAVDGLGQRRRLQGPAQIGDVGHRFGRGRHHAAPVAWS